MTQEALIAHARHELRTPLNAIIGYSELLLDDLQEADTPLGDAYVRDVGRIHRAGQDLLALVNRLVEPSAIEDAEAAGMDAYRCGLMHELRTLLSSAIGYCEILREDAGADHSEIGAAMAESLAKIHRAAVRLLSRADEVTAKLAVTDVATAAMPVDAPAAAPQPLRPTGDVPAPAAFVPARVLVVDDEEMNRDLLDRQVRRLGHEVALAHDGRSALDMLQTSAYDLVLLDVLMPGIDGMQTLAQIKGDPLLAAIPVIMISALDELPSVVRCIELGAEEYMPKTVDPVLLRARLGATLEKKALRDRERLHLAQLEAEKRRADELLRVILPEEIIQELQATDRVNPRLYPDVAVLFCDVVGFTPYCASRPPGEVIAHLQELIERYELIAQRHGVQKIKTVGDAFVATAGLLSAVNEPVLRCVRCGLEMVAEARRISAGWDVRVGIHRGPVVAGVVGRLQFQFDLWGDTVNTAARVESSGAVGAVNLSESAWQVVARRCSGRSLGTVELRGKGAVELFRVDEVLA